MYVIMLVAHIIPLMDTDYENRFMAIRLITLVFSLLFLAGLAQAHDERPGSVLPYAKNLQITAEDAIKQRLPIMIMFVTDDCPYCKTAKEEFIRPMILSGEYDDKVLIRLIEIDRTDEIIDFLGKHTTMVDFASKHKAHFTPYVKFFDGKGNEIAKPIIGITNKDYYGMFIDDAIESALEKLRQTR
ncbi:MAG: thioredoxin fold domain-containing protein [Gammaproteobacteria bacterium]|nr:thioredoxin fold domain-containing protein [Gammaproteobacteria bacterium]MDH5593552.1 thioredoxin fold domain-containing protein [Gammaproteobacteria bacterium]